MSVPSAVVTVAVHCWRLGRKWFTASRLRMLADRTSMRGVHDRVPKSDVDQCLIVDDAAVEDDNLLGNSA